MDTSSAISVTSDESDATCGTPNAALTAAAAVAGGGVVNGRTKSACNTFEDGHFGHSAGLGETANSDNVSDIDISEEHRGSEAEGEAEGEGEGDADSSGGEE